MNERQVLADIVEKVENRSSPKNLAKVDLGASVLLHRLSAPLRGPWSTSDENKLIPQSPRVRRISGSKDFRSSPQKDFFNSIGAKLPFVVWDDLTSECLP